MLTNAKHLSELKASEQKIYARVELYRGSTLEKICNCGEVLEKFAVEKTGEGKFFGFGFCQKLTATLIDIHNTIDLNVIDGLEASFGVDSDFIYPFPKFYLQEVERDEVFNVINIAAYDALYGAAAHTIEELKLVPPYTIKHFAGAIASALGLPLVIDSKAASAFELYFSAGANFGGKETLRAALDAIAEATQTIYYIDSSWNLYFKRLDISGAAKLAIGKNEYIELTDNGARALGSVAHITELGDNVEADSDEGFTQYVRNNPFWENRTDIATLLNNAQAATKGLSIHQHRCDWAGNYLLELGDKISIAKDDDTILTTYVLDDNITYDGTLWQVLSWAFDGSEAESATNPTSLGDALNTTFARVDKLNKEIILFAGEVDGLNKQYSELKLTTEGIAGRVEKAEETVEGYEERVGKLELTAKGFETELSAKLTQEDLNGYPTKTEMNSAIKQSADKIALTVEETNERVDEVEKKAGNVELTASGLSASFEKTIERVSTLEGDSATKEELSGAIEKLSSDFKLDAVEGLLTFKKETEANGVSQVSGTGFRFSADGLEINKTDAPTSTLIDETGMTVSDNNSEVLVANDSGVSAKNLHATTYIFIGANSRLETYTNGGEERTACFWVGR